MPSLLSWVTHSSFLTLPWLSWDWPTLSWRVHFGLWWLSLLLTISLAQPMECELYVECCKSLYHCLYCYSMQAIQNLGLAIFTIVTGAIVDSSGYLILEVFFLATLCVALISGK